MTSSTPLQLFPAPHRTAVPRKSSLKKPSPSNTSPVTPGELKGVAIQVTSPSGTSGSPNVQPANDHIKHSLFCDSDSASSGQHGQARPRRHARARRNSGASQPSSSDSPYHSGESFGEITPLPINTSFGPATTSPRKSPASQLKRPIVPPHISVEVLPDTDMMASPNGDKLSPLPTKESFGAVSPLRSEYPKPASVRSASPTLVRSNSGASTTKSAKSPPQYDAPMRSIFPQYDHTRTFQEQDYYPSVRSPTPTLPTGKVSKLASPDCKRPELERFDSAVALVDGYEHIKLGSYADMVALWNASCEIFPCSGSKMQLGLHQPRASGTSLAIGVSPNQILYSMSKATTAPSSHKHKDVDPTLSCVLSVTKHNPQNDLTETIARMGLPDPSRTEENDTIPIFPQPAAIAAITAIATTPAAAEIAQFDPTASGPAAKRLAQDAVAAAHARHRCALRRATRARDSLGAVTATYDLEHPTLGRFAVTVAKSTAGGRHVRDPRARVCLHHPSATPAAIAAETLVLACLDFAREAAVLDVPGLLALEGPWVIDTVVCAVLAVAVVENDALMAETVRFEAPPTRAITSTAAGGGSGSVKERGSKGAGRHWYGRKRKGRTEEGEQVELALATEAALGLLGLSFKTAVFVLEVGVKVTAGAIVGATHLAKKL